MVSITLTVFFEDPFWVAVVERQDGDQLQAARHVFGAEPAPPEISQFVLFRLGTLLAQPSATVVVTPAMSRPHNPKRTMREAARELQNHGTSTGAQEALRLQIEQNKRSRRQRGKIEREAEHDRQRALKIEKAKARHRGR